MEKSGKNGKKNGKWKSLPIVQKTKFFTFLIKQKSQTKNKINNHTKKRDFTKKMKRGCGAAARVLCNLCVFRTSSSRSNRQMVFVSSFHVNQSRKLLGNLEFEIINNVGKWKQSRDIRSIQRD